MGKLYVFGYNGFGQLRPDRSDNFLVHPVELEATEPDGDGDALVAMVTASWSSAAIFAGKTVIMTQGFLNAESHQFRKFETAAVRSSVWTADGLVVVREGGECVQVDPCTGQQLGRWNGPDGAKFTDVVCGESTILALTDTGDVTMLGDVQSINPTPLPVHVGENVKAVCCGKEHSLALTVSGRVFSWGNGSRGQLGHGTTEACNTPQVIEALEGVTMVTIAAGGWHSVSVSACGDLYVWGWNEAGQLGLPTSKHKTGPSDGCTTCTDKEPSVSDMAQQGDNVAEVLVQATPTIVDLPTGQELSKISCGSRHTAALTKEGQLLTWGWGAYGQLGNGQTERCEVPCTVEFFKQRRVTDVWCGPWNVFVQVDK
ncbi:RCCD1 [Branchiostoma lanceolatum]|uniref:RCCD1 protein n=1 Tax=Branchiostoma lanceolatum TaxID=7740 RepID=A0A8J9ZP77_BRALA|nr:RCCD1 [Branchiostoma lanceolatum]